MCVGIRECPFNKNLLNPHFYMYGVCMAKNLVSGLIGAFMRLLDSEVHREEPLKVEKHRAELEEFFTIREMECLCCDYDWTAMVPLELEVIFEAKLECPSCGMNSGAINEKSHTKKTKRN